MRKVIYENDNISIDSGLFFGRGVFDIFRSTYKKIK